MSEIYFIAHALAGLLCYLVAVLGWLGVVNRIDYQLTVARFVQLSFMTVLYCLGGFLGSYFFFRIPNIGDPFFDSTNLVWYVGAVMLAALLFIYGLKKSEPLSFSFSFLLLIVAGAIYA